MEDFLIVPSKFTEGNKDCLHIQISIGENKHVVFTGSNVLINMIKKVSTEDFPFKTTIIKSNEYFPFHFWGVQFRICDQSEQFSSNLFENR